MTIQSMGKKRGRSRGVLLRQAVDFKRDSM